MAGDGKATCLICDGPLDGEGRCLNVNEFWHSDLQSDYEPPRIEDLEKLEDIS